MKKYLLVILMLFYFLSFSLAQVNYDTIFIYKCYEKRGHTTAGAVSKFKELKDDHIELIAIDSSDLKKINEILKKADTKRHLQTKLGVGLIFGQAEMNGNFIDILFDSVVIIDMTNYKNFWIKNKEHQAWLKNFINKIKINGS